MNIPLRRRLLAELLGSAFLGAVVIGAGIAAQRLSPNDIGLRLFEDAAATAAGLFAIILMFGPVSGGHFNPVVSFVDAHFGGISRRDALAYLPAQVASCTLGVVVANIMFLAKRGQHLDPSPSQPRSLPLRDHRHRWADLGSPRLSPNTQRVESRA